MSTLAELAVIVRAQIIDMQEKFADAEKSFSKLTQTAGVEAKALDARFRLAETTTKGYATSLIGLSEKHVLLTEKLKLATLSVNSLQQQYDILAQKPGVTAEALAKMSVRVDEAKIKQEQLRQEFEKIDTPMKRFGIAAGEVGDKLSKWGSDLTKKVTVPLMAVGTAIVGLVVKMAGMADELETMSAQTGLSVEKLMELRYVASQTNTKFDAITIAVANMTKNMVASTEEGSKMEAAYNRIGVQVKNADGSFRSMNDVFPETLKALAEMSPGVERDGLLMEIFGTRAKELIPLLNAGAAGIDAFTAESHELNLVSPETNKALADFHDLMEKVKQILAAAFAELAAKFLPILRDKLVPLITDTIVPALIKFADWIGGLIDKFMGLSPGMQDFILKALALFVALGPVLTVIGTITKGVGLLSTALSFLAANPVVLVVAGVALLVLGIIQLIKHWDDVKAAGIRAWEGIKPYIQPVIDLVKWCSDAIQDVIAWFGRLFGIQKGSLAADVSEVTDSVQGLERALWVDSLIPALAAWGAASDVADRSTRALANTAKDFADLTTNVVTPAVEGAAGAIQAYVSTAQKLADDWAKTTKAITEAGGIKEYATEWAVEKQMASPSGKIVGGAKDLMDALKATVPDYAAQVAAMATAAGVDLGVGETMLRNKLLREYEAGPGLAAGGTTINAGMYDVGERGIERLFLPAGTTVVPLSQGGNAASRAMGAPAESNVFNVTMQVRADDIRSLADLIDLFKRLPQTARAMGG